MDLCPHGKAALKHIKDDLDLIENALCYAAGHCTSPTGQGFVQPALHALDRIRRAVNQPETPDA